MKNLPWIPAALFVAACHPGGEDTDLIPEAYLTVVGDFVEVEGLTQFCISPRQWYSEDEYLPGAVLEALESSGYYLWPDQGVYPDTSAHILTLSRPIPDSLGLHIVADLGVQWINPDGYLRWAGKSWDYFLDCEGGGCEIALRLGPGHSDASGSKDSPMTRAIISGTATKCPGA